MAKVNFELIKTRLADQSNAYNYEQDWARCDLALPAMDLRIIAGVLDTLPWIERATEHDGALYIRRQYNKAWLIQERAFHAALGIARQLIAEVLHKLRTESPEATPEPEIVERYTLSHRGAYANVAPSQSERNGTISYDGCTIMRNGKPPLSYIMPEDHYGAGFVVHYNEEGKPQGYFLTSRCHDNEKRKTLAAALLSKLYPELEIAGCNRKSYDEVAINGSSDRIASLLASSDLRDHAVACYNMTYVLIEGFRQKVAELQWKGHPSVFLDEDDDARDIILDAVKNGATIERVRREGAEYNDVDGVCEFTLSDGTPLPHYIVTRLQNAEAIIPLGYPFERSCRPDEPLPPLVANPKAKPEVLKPRQSCVPFQAFQSYCSHRRYDGHRECVHPSSGGDYCGAGYCPLTTQVYSQDVGSYGLDFNEDPAFDDHDWERDLMVYAIHRNTERSYAWRAAGEQAVLAIVNQLIQDTYGMKIPNRLYGKENMRAVRQAITDGWLVVEKEMPEFGVVVRLSPSTIAKVEEQIAARKAHDETKAKENA